MKVLQETPSLCLVQDPFFEFSEFWGTCKEPPDPLSSPLFTSWIMCLYILLVLQVFWFHGGGGGGGWRPIVLIIKNDVLLILLKNVLLHSVFFFLFIWFPLSRFSFYHLVFKMEIFDWSAGLLLDLIFAHKCYLYLREYLLKFIFIIWKEYWKRNWSDITEVYFLVCPTEGKLSMCKCSCQVCASQWS